jgi:argonaute-like protein implicated in RNA metabolism and viral defense
LLWTQGNVPQAARGRDYYKEGKGVPTPLLLRRFAGHGAWHDVCSATLGLTKMNWNNDSLYDRLPVTLEFSGALANVIKRFPAASNGLYEFRYFM